MTEKKAPEKGKGGVRVTASLVQVKSVAGTVFYLYAGDIVDTDKVSPESLKHLESLGFIESD